MIHLKLTVLNLSYDGVHMILVSNTSLKQVLFCPQQRRKMLQSVQPDINVIVINGGRNYCQSVLESRCPIGKIQICRSLEYSRADCHVRTRKFSDVSRTNSVLIYRVCRRSGRTKTDHRQLCFYQTTSTL